MHVFRMSQEYLFSDSSIYRDDGFLSFFYLSFAMVVVTPYFPNVGESRSIRNFYADADSGVRNSRCHVRLYRLMSHQREQHDIAIYLGSHVGFLSCFLNIRTLPFL